MKPAGAHDGAAQQGNTFGRGTGSSGGYLVTDSVEPMAVRTATMS